MRQQCKKANLLIHLLQLHDRGTVVLVVVIRFQILDYKVPALLASGIVALVVIEVRVLGIGVVEGPLDKMIRQIVAPIVVGAVLKVNDNEIRLSIYGEARVQCRIVRSVQLRAGGRRYCAVHLATAI